MEGWNPLENPQPMSQGVPQPSLLFGCPGLSNPQLAAATHSDRGVPAPRDVALGLCLGVEELQHHPSDFGVGFSRGGRWEVGRAGREKHKHLSPGCELQATPPVPQHSSRTGRAGAQHIPQQHPGPISPAGQTSTGTPAALQSPRGQGGLGKGGQMEPDSNTGETGWGRARELGCAAVRAAAAERGQLAPNSSRAQGGDVTRGGNVTQGKAPDLWHQRPRALTPKEMPCPVCRSGDTSLQAEHPGI